MKSDCARTSNARGLLTIMLAAIALGAWTTPPGSSDGRAQPLGQQSPWFSRYAPDLDDTKNRALRFKTASQLFQHARWSPRDVTFYVHLTDPAAMRDRLGDKPAGQWLTRRLHRGRLPDVWQKFADAVAMPEDALFDRAFSRPCTLLVRANHNDRAGKRAHDEQCSKRRAPQRQWVLITSMKAQTLKPLLHQLKPRLHLPRCGMAIEELPEHELLVAYDARQTVIVGPAKRRGLFNEVVDLFKRRDHDRVSLADQPFMHTTKTLGRGQIAIYARHHKRTGGWSALVGRMRDDVLHVRHLARFDTPPFDSTIAAQPIDVSPLHAMEDHAILAMLQPNAIGPGPVESFLQCAAGETFISEALRTHLRARRITVFSEQNVSIDADARHASGPTAITACVELQPDKDLHNDLDLHMNKLAARLQKFARKDEQHGRREHKSRNEKHQRSRPNHETNPGAATEDLALHLHLPNDAPQDDLTDAGHISLAQDVQRVFSTVPTLGEVSLNWDVVECSQSRWAAFSSSAEQLASVSTALRTSPTQSPTERAAQGVDDSSESAVLANVSSCGTVNGERFNQAMQAWLARKYDSQTDVRKRCRADEYWHNLSQLAGTIERLRWQLIRPKKTHMRLDIQIILSNGTE